ncbi:MAG: hydantoinase/oxoprolinase family protein, partial [Pseudomonadota bacterium]
MNDENAVESRYRIGIDVGGTFTDFVIARTDGASLAVHKEPSVPDDPSLAVERGTSALIEKLGVLPGEIELVVHGTTLALNAIIQRRGAKVALVVSSGNRDIMEIARARMPNSYDFTAGREPPLVPRESVFEVSARGLADGSVLTEADPEELAALAERISAEGHEAVAVMLLNSYRAPALEKRVAEGLAQHLTIPVTPSAEIWPEIREYERALVTSLNAFVAPAMDAYFETLERRFRTLGVTAPIYITGNNGGTVSIATGRARPIETVLSGPASGVLAATRVADEAQLLTFDMGGTSTDISVAIGGALDFTNTSMIGDYPLMLPVVAVNAIGAGGGSIVWVDAQGLLKVGPESAGADPGPVAYGRGGTRPTMTDCYVVLGILEPDRFLGGRMRLDADAARAALEEIGEKTGLGGAADVAAAAVRVATAKMATELRKLLAQKGHDPRRFTVAAFGGAGPTHANWLAEEARLDAVLVPRLPGTFCALGAILADVRRDYVRAVRLTIDETGEGWPTIDAALQELEAEARAFIAEEGALIGAHSLCLVADMRYPAQAFELAISVPDYNRGSLDAAGLIALYNAEHDRLYGF